jgi:hypothetical protein
MRIGVREAPSISTSASLGDAAAGLEVAADDQLAQLELGANGLARCRRLPPIPVWSSCGAQRITFGVPGGGAFGLHHLLDQLARPHRAGSRC